MLDVADDWVKVAGQQSALAFGLMGPHRYPVVAMLGRVCTCASLPLFANRSIDTDQKVPSI